MEEEEEMLSGEDADAAASKLQARMRGKAARQEVADLKASKEAADADAPALRFAPGPVQHMNEPVHRTNHNCQRK